MPADIQDDIDTNKSIVDILASDVDTSFKLYEKDTNIILEDNYIDDYLFLNEMSSS